MSTPTSKKIVIRVEETGIMVYDDISQSRIDLFNNSNEGIEEALTLVEELMKE